MLDECVILSPMPDPNFFVGTSGYAYKEWKGSFYPDDLPAKGFLKFYAEQFRAVEINNSFYRTPKPEVLKSWADEVPDGFVFVMKASQGITHFKRLKDCGDSIAYLLKNFSALKKHLGPILFQLHPNMKKDAPRLAQFFKLIPKKQRVAFEFRNASWFDDEIFDILRDHKAVLCIAEAENDLETPFVSTADWGYIRLRMKKYSDAELESRLKEIRKQGWSDAFVFFKHEDEGIGPKMARKMLALAAKA